MKIDVIYTFKIYSDKNSFILLLLFNFNKIIARLKLVNNCNMGYKMLFEVSF